MARFGLLSELFCSPGEHAPVCLFKATTNDIGGCLIAGLRLQPMEPKIPSCMSGIGGDDHLPHSGKFQGNHTVSVGICKTAAPIHQCRPWHVWNIGSLCLFFDHWCDFEDRVSSVAFCETICSMMASARGQFRRPYPVCFQPKLTGPSLLAQTPIADNIHDTVASSDKEFSEIVSLVLQHAGFNISPVSRRCSLASRHCVSVQYLSYNISFVLSPFSPLSWAQDCRSDKMVRILHGYHERRRGPIRMGDPETSRRLRYTYG